MYYEYTMTLSCRHKRFSFKRARTHRVLQSAPKSGMGRIACQLPWQFDEHHHTSTLLLLLLSWHAGAGDDPRGVAEASVYDPALTPRLQTEHARERLTRSGEPKVPLVIIMLWLDTSFLGRLSPFYDRH